MRLTPVCILVLTIFMFLSLRAVAAESSKKNSISFSNGVVIESQQLSPPRNLRRVKSPTPPPTTSAPFTNFCVKSKYHIPPSKPNEVHCNWFESFSAACAITKLDRWIEKEAIISGPTDVGHCSNGDTVIKVTNN
jgi:hypothetical protein